jgi:hypothetical protein
MPPTITPAIPALRSQFGGLLPSTLPAAKWVDTLMLSANTAKSYAVPSDASGNRAFVARISGSTLKSNATGELYINFYGTAAAPTVDVLDGSASTEVNGPADWVVIPSDCAAISFLATTSGAITIECWASK